MIAAAAAATTTAAARSPPPATPLLVNLGVRSRRSPVRGDVHLPRGQLESNPALRSRILGLRRMAAAAGSGAGDGPGPLAAIPGVAAKVAPETKGFMFQQTMLRVRDPQVSLDFYTRVLGMRLMAKFDFQDAKFTLLFLGYANEEDIPADEAERAAWVFSQPACLELTHNWGTESDDTFQGYHDGNSDPRGFGHIGISVPDVYAACARFEELGVEFKKTPDGGSMKGLAFIKDPDGYWIEVLSSGEMRKLLSK